MNRLTPHDYETFVMIAQLLGQEPTVREIEGSNRFIIEAHYKAEHTPDYLCAVISAVGGRFGKRYLEVADNAECKYLEFAIAYDDHEFPEVCGTMEMSKPLDCSGDEYRSAYEQIKAIQVTRSNCNRVQSFVGGGEMTIEKCPNGKAWFTFLNHGVFVDVNEYDYIVKRKNASGFEVWKKAEFEHTWKQS